MKLYHISEQSDIIKFEPRVPTRGDLDKTKSLVWTVSEKCLPNFLTPRDCPRIAYYATERTSIEDIGKFFCSAARHCLAIEHKWVEPMSKVKLYLYEFDSKNFYLQDEVAGYYVSEKAQTPISMTVLTDLFKQLDERDIEIRILNNLWQLADEVQASTLNWSLCRMANAQKRP